MWGSHTTYWLLLSKVVYRDGERACVHIGVCLALQAEPERYFPLLLEDGHLALSVPSTLKRRPEVGPYRGETIDERCIEWLNCRALQVTEVTADQVEPAPSPRTLIFFTCLYVCVFAQQDPGIPVVPCDRRLRSASSALPGTLHVTEVTADQGEPALKQQVGLPARLPACLPACLTA
jgi:hypothetical protein